MFLHVSVIHSVHRGACMVAWGGMHGCSGGHAWLLRGACMVALGGACVVDPGACMVAWGHAWLLLGGVHAWLLGGVHGFSQGGMCGCSGGHAWDTMRYADTVNERAVCILLECILVSKNHALNVTYTKLNKTRKICPRKFAQGVGFKSKYSLLAKSTHLK